MGDLDIYTSLKSELVHRSTAIQELKQKASVIFHQAVVSGETSKSLGAHLDAVKRQLTEAQDELAASRAETAATLAMLKAYVDTGTIVSSSSLNVSIHNIIHGDSNTV
jgi:uncharacterized coiled-coil DUF342 family protein